MFTIAQILHGVGACAVIAACSATRAAPSTAPSAQNPSFAPWNLTFHVTGGFAGLDRKLELASSGELTAMDRKRAMCVAAVAPASEVARIASLIADLPSVDSDRRNDCRDCLQYDVEIHVQGRSLVSRLNDMSLAASGLDPLVTALTALLNRVLAAQLKPDNGPNAENFGEPLHGNASLGARLDCPVAGSRSRRDQPARADQRTSDSRSTA
jgi:hypothetical protein